MHTDIHSNQDRFEMMHLGRKACLFILVLIVLVVLSILDKDSAAIVALYGTYCAGNVGTHFSSSISRREDVCQ